MTWRQDRLPELVRAISGRPRHEALRGHIIELLRSGFGASYEDIAHEVYLLDNTGRIDTLWGATVIELKSDLRREIGDVLARMPAYIADAAARTQSSAPVTGVATDGATFIAYGLRDGELHELARYTTDPERPDELMAWLEPLLSDRPDLIPAPRIVAQTFGRGSLTFAGARVVLDALWAELQFDPEVRLKRDLWDGLLREAYGEDVGGDALFLQHTYLVVVVKAIAARVLDLPVDDPEALLSGQALVDEGIVGAVEADFFDWPLKTPTGTDLVRQIATQVARFRLRDVEADVLKVLYESLVDPEERHDLGEYYTPDWLAGRIVAEAVNAPLTQRVIDPACGSGTFLFHAVRRLIAAGNAAGWPAPDILEACADKVRGLDVHPVAVTLARVTWLLALGELVLDRPARLTVPVFLGDALQSNLRRYLDRSDVLVEVPNEQPLQVPTGFAEDQALFEQGLDVLSQGLRDDATPEAVGRQLLRISGAAPADADALTGTFARLQALYRAGRNGIWVFIFRNLVRPVWLSRPEQRADVLVGNPPWIVYRHLSPAMKDRLREGLEGYGLWLGGNLASQQDICALFWARAAERYLSTGGRVAFVLPYAVLNAPVFAALRAGRMNEVQVGLTGAWALERVWPIFGAQSGSSTTSTCVLFGRRDFEGAPPQEIDRWEGHLSRRDAGEAEAARNLTHTRIPWPRPRTLIGESLYRSRFRNGATIYPRRFFIVEAEQTGRLGGRRDAPRMRGRAGILDKLPWTEVEPPRGPVETPFLRQLVLGESLAPYRLLETVTAVVPLDGARLLDAAGAASAGHRHLAAWLRDAEEKWSERSSKRADGRTAMTLLQRIDHMRNLSAQAGPPTIRVLYTKSGTRLSATTIIGGDTLVDHMAYWAPVRSQNEANYLTAILNSSIVLGKISEFQPHGQRDKRHFDNLVWTLPIPEYDADEALHRDLAAAAARAEAVAASVDLSQARHFTAKRRAIREALAQDGVAAEIEALVDALLPP
ncbi:MAG: N-6 DNA methylase [Phenylobacterium sp.]|uniref:N-6 DNA methylase n=1 Tax=Phenylobacterium sp. TaxID=1871053 RepID=UPI002733D244|nr:N-6 DNA methylase [Phenylobacterium sp.]MDP3746352.1 N-6 DNA methylase [Phenylobacterium sp.]